MDNAIETDGVFGVAEMLERCMGEPDLAQEILGIFKVQAPEHVEGIGRALAAGELAEASRRGHALKGMSGNVACKSLATAAGAVELSGRAGDVAGATVGYEAAKVAVAGALAALPGVLAELGKAQAA